MIHSSVEQFRQAMEFKGLTPCPQDGRWEIPTDSDICTEVETVALVFGMMRALRPMFVVETGCNVGVVTHAILQALKANGDLGMLATCDTEDSHVASVHARMDCLQLCACTCPGLALVQKLADRCDLYWIDSSEESRALELEWLRTHGKPGAVVLVHDTSLMGALADVVRSFPRHVLLPGPRGLGIITL